MEDGRYARWWGANHTETWSTEVASRCGRIETSFFLKVVLHNHGGRSVGRPRVRIHLALFLRALVLSLLRRWSPRSMWDLCLPLAATPTMAVNVDSQPPNPLATFN